MDKVIRATITVEVPYSNEFLNYGDKFDKKLKEILNQQFICCKVEAGNLEPNGMPVLKEKYE